MLIPITLAQIFEPELPGVTPTPFIETWVTGSGIPGAAAAFAIAAITAFALSRAGRPRIAWILTGLITTIGIGVLIIGQTVTTTREVLSQRTAELVDAAATADRDTLTRLLHPDIEVRTRFGSGTGRDNVITLSERAAGYIEQHSIKRAAIDPRGSQVARTLITLRLDAANLPRLSQWTFNWQRDSLESDWQAVRIEPIWIQGIDNTAGSP